MIKTIFIYEYKLLLRNKILLVALLLFTIVALVSFNKGVTYYNIQKNEADTVRAGTERAYIKLKNKFDTANFSQPEPLALEGVWAVDWSIWEYAVKQHNPLSTIAIGQNDIFSKIKRTRFATDMFNGANDEFKNPEQLLTGNLDVSYFILFLFPLLFIAISYNTASADKESGINKLLATQSFSLKSIITTRVIFKWLVSLLPFLITITTTYFVINKYDAFSSTAFLKWIAVALFYSLFWLSIVLFIINLGLNSMLNAITLVGVWLLLLVGIPGILNSWFQYKYPPDTQQQIARLRDEKAKIYDLPVKEQTAFFKAYFPTIKIDPAVFDTAEIKWYSGAVQDLQLEKKVLNTITESRNIQAAKEEQLFWINPIGGIMRAFTTISGSTLQQQQNFENYLMDFKQQRADYLITNHTIKKHFDNVAFANMPRYKALLAKQSPVWYFLLPAIILFTTLSIGHILIKPNKL